MFSVAQLLDQLPSSGGLEIKKLEKILKLTKKGDRAHLDIAIKALTKLGIIEEEEDGTLKKNQNQGLVEARLRCSSKGYCFAIRENGTDDIYIRDQHLNHAWNGDRVLVKITREGIRRRSPEGEVKCILERTNSSMLSIVEEEEENLIAIPLDDRILASVNLSETDKAYLSDYNDKNKDKVLEIKIDRFPVAQYQAEGHVVRALPLNGGTEADKDLLLTKANLHEQIPAPRSSPKLPSNKNRLDLTKQPTLLLNSWTSTNCPSLAALHVEPHGGGIRLWIHAPSVAERVSNGNTLDLWMKERSESHCLGDNWISLLSEPLTKACEFRVGEVNESISACIDINSNGELIDWQFSLANIKPIASLTPSDLTVIANRKPRARTIPNSIKHLKDQLDQIKTVIYCSELLQNRENKNGEIELNLPAPELDNLSDLKWADPSTRLQHWRLPLDTSDPNSLLAPLIRAANRAWGRHITNLNIPGLIINNDPIDANCLADVAKAALALDIELKLDIEGMASPSEMVNAFKEKSCQRVLEKLIRHSMPDSKLIMNDQNNQVAITNEALSDNNNIPLPSENIQAPWCTPSMHYYDIVNQQIMLTVLKELKPKGSSRSKSSQDFDKKSCDKDSYKLHVDQNTHSGLASLCTETLINKLTTKHRQADLLRNGLISMSQARSAESLIGQELEAVITGVQSYGFFAEIPPFMAEGLVHVSSLNDDWYEYRSRQNRLVGRKNRKIYQLGDSIRVRVLKVDALRNQIDLEVNSDNHENSNDTENIDDSNINEQVNHQLTNFSNEFTPIPVVIDEG